MDQQQVVVAQVELASVPKQGRSHLAYRPQSPCPSGAYSLRLRTNTLAVLTRLGTGSSSSQSQLSSIRHNLSSSRATSRTGLRLGRSLITSLCHRSKLANRAYSLVVITIILAETPIASATINKLQLNLPISDVSC